MQTEVPVSPGNVQDNHTCEEPEGELEQVLAGLWQQVFQLERVGRDENFFELGGNSLLGMELTEMVATRFAIELPVVALFQYPTVREMALLVDEIGRGEI